jgi:hypothetical protein
MTSRNRVFSFLVSAFLAATGLVLAQTTVVFTDGSRMEVQSYEVKESLVLLKTKEGKLMSVPRSYVDLQATERGKRAPAGAEKAPAPKPAPLPSATVEPEPPVRAPDPAPAPAPAPPPPATPPPAARPSLTASPPPVWSNDELRVSLVVPSTAWNIEDIPPSFDVAAALSNASSEARATLALIRQKLRGSGDFRNVVRDVERSISQAPGFRSIANGPLTLEPYLAHEFRFVKDGGSAPVFSRLAVVYSRDLAYVLSLTCPESRVSENDADFEAIVRGLVIKKSRKDLSF